MYIKKYKKACPICKGDVKGNSKSKYYCRNCNILYDYGDLLNPRNPEIETDNPAILRRKSDKKK